MGAVLRELTMAVLYNCIHKVLIECILRRIKMAHPVMQHFWCQFYMILYAISMLTIAKGLIGCNAIAGEQEAPFWEVEGVFVPVKGCVVTGKACIERVGYSLGGEGNVVKANLSL